VEGWIAIFRDTPIENCFSEQHDIKDVWYIRSYGIEQGFASGTSSERTEYYAPHPSIMPIQIQQSQNAI
jgi:hypothetical protein